MKSNAIIFITLLWIVCIGLFIGGLRNSNTLVQQRAIIALKQKQTKIQKRPGSTKLSLIPKQNPDFLTSSSSGAVSLSVTPGLIQTVNWQTYSSTAGKITFQYPPNAALHINEEHVFETNTYQPKPQLIELDVDPSLVSAIPSIEIEYFTQDPLTVIYQRIQAIQYCLLKDAPKKGTTIVVGTQPGTLFQTACGVAGGDIIFLINNGIGYVISVNSADYNRTFFRTFLSTITFTK